eukprot:TRINITY_DN4290_c0_g1_i1.p1 TRINITY_DN4290_c0_g1~~TRINITY_DN4290_c0_g1_i1.p1  ORF type:complete len:899 (+),score=285.06 TRINITY_DN4290_c0_g1_i1:317-3013(+)
MSVVGFDVGNESGIVAVARQRGIDVVLNEESKRETPVMVSFGESQRFLGVAASASATMNPKNTISQIKRLIGRKFSDPEVQKDLAMLPFVVTEGPNGDPLINVSYLNEKRVFTPTEVLAMSLSSLKSIAEKNLGVSVVDCVIGIPVYFTDAQRRAYLDAASITGLHPLRLMHEPTATALAYGIYKTDLSETEPLNVAFVDVGHSSMQVCIAAFRKGQLKILAHAFERSLGGRDFDEVLFDHFADEFKKEYSIDVRSNARASLRLRASCEKMKKVLSANPEAPLNIECLMDEKDVKGFMKRELFESLAAPILELVKIPCLKALEDSGLTVDKISVVELVGSGTRVPTIMKIISQVFKKEPSRTMNASECIARGCALQCAMLSPTFRVRDFEVQDTYPFPIALSWKQVVAPQSEGGAGGAGEGEELAAQPNQIVFTKGNPLPSSKLLTFYRHETFTIDAFYADMSELPSGADPKIGTFTVGPFPARSDARPDSKPKLKVKIRLNLHGILLLESATMLEEEESVKEVAPMDVDQKSASAPAAASEAANSDQASGAAAANGDAPTGSENGPAPTAENKVEEEKTAEEKKTVDASSAKKKKTKRTEVPIQAVLVGGLPQGELQKAIEKEYEMALQDRVMEETKEKKNSVEAYVYEMRNKLYDKLGAYATESEKEAILAKLQQTEDWLYEDGENETKGVYIAKLEELKKMGDPVEERWKEEEARGPAITALNYCISSFRDAAISRDTKFDHVDAGDKQKVIEECNKAEAWLKEKQQLQAQLPKIANPVLLSGDVKKKAETLDRFCKPIMTKPKPKPQPAAAGGGGAAAGSGPSPASGGEEKQQPPPPPAGDAAAEAASTAAGEGEGAAAAESATGGSSGGEAMETDARGEGNAGASKGEPMETD